MEFRILGPVELWGDGERYVLGSRKERCVLAVLLWDLGHPILAETILRRVWGVDASDKALSLLYTNVSRLRTRLGGISGTERDWLPRRAGCYMLDVSRADVDLWRFRELRDKAKAAAARGDDELAVALFRQAEGLWHGVPLTGLDGVWAEGVRATLNEEWLEAAQERIRAALRLGRHAELVGEITGLVVRHPLDEDLVELLMRALYRSGRRAEALAAYRQLDRRWRDEFGGDPGLSLRDLHQRMLRDDPALSYEAASCRAVVSQAAPTAVPASTMPRDDPDFTGRDAELRALLAWINTAEAQSTVPVAVISGMPGVGKSTIAVHAAHLLREGYPDQLYVSLRAHDPAGVPLDPAAALATLLRRLGVPDNVLPADADDRAALWRSMLAGRRALIVLDDALNAEQVLPLLPGTPGCLVLVTTRHRTLSLAGMLPLPLNPMPHDEAATLFTRIAGAGRAADPAAVATVVRLCGYVPLEIQIAGSRLRNHLAWSTGDLASRLRDMPSEGRRMTMALELSYRYLTISQQRLLRLLALHPGDSFSAHAAAALAGGESLTEIGHTLEVLLDYHFIEENAPGRFAFHDLIRSCAEGLAAADTEQDRRQAMRWLLGYYLGLAGRADRMVHPFHRRIPLPTTLVIPAMPPLSGPDDCREQLEAEKASLLGIARYAAADGWPEHAALLAHLLGKFLDTWGDWRDAIDLHRRAVGAWRALGNTSGEAIALTELSFILGRAGEHGEALSRARDALTIARATADKGGEANALDIMGLMLWRAARYTEALDHHTEALSIWRALGDGHGEADALWHTAIALWHLRKYPDALRRTERALALYRELGDPQGETNSLNFLGGMQQDAECYEQALGSYQQALAKFQALGDRQGEAIAFSNIGDIRRLSGHHTAALQGYRAALDIFRRIGDRRSEAETLNGMGAAFLDAGDHAAALEHHQKALILATELAERYVQVVSHLSIGAAHLAMGSFGTAADSYRCATDLGLQIGDPRHEADALYGLGCALLPTEGEAAAREPWRQALGRYESLECPEAAAVRARLHQLETGGGQGDATDRSDDMTANHPRPAA